MAKFNYGIDCSNESEANEIFRSLQGLNIYSDGLDLEDTRISVISSQALNLELEQISKIHKFDITVEVWPEDEEYDDAEANGSLEIYNYTSEPNQSTQIEGIFNYKIYCDEEDFGPLKIWLSAADNGRIQILDEWETEWGSCGFELSCGDAKFDKYVKENCDLKSVITEKAKN